MLKTYTYFEEEIQKKELEEVIILLKELALISTKKKIKYTINIYEFINYKLEFDPNNSYISIEKNIICILNKNHNRIDTKAIEEVNDIQINNVVSNRVRF